MSWCALINNCWIISSCTHKIQQLLLLSKAQRLQHSVCKKRFATECFNNHFIKPVLPRDPSPLAASFYQSDKLRFQSGVPILSAPPETKTELQNISTHVSQNWACEATVYACTQTLRHLSMLSALDLFSGSGTSRSTVSQHDTVAQEEHTRDWYFQSAGLATLWNSQRQKRWHYLHCLGGLITNRFH